MGRRLTSEDVLDLLRELFIARGLPKSLHSDNGSEFTAQQVSKWLQSLAVKTLFIAPGSPWENGYLESFTRKPRDELLNGEIFDTSAQALLERWRQPYNRERPHTALGYRPPALAACLPPGLALARDGHPSAAQTAATLTQEGVAK